MTRPTALIIGSGVAGLATAIRLAAKGYAVQVFEAADAPGGKLAELQLGPYRFDRGPSLFTRPDLVEELFQVAGVSMTGRFSYHKLEEANRYFWDDGTRLTGWSDPGLFAAEVERVLGVPAERVNKHLHRAHTLLDTTGRTFLEHSLHRPAELLRGGFMRALTAVRPAELLRPLHAVNRSGLGDARATQLFDRFATYNGSDPYRTSALYSMIPSFEHGEGAYFPTEGMASIGTSLVKLAEEIGVRFHLSTRVETICRVGIRWQVETQAGTRTSDALISNADITHLYRNLMPEAPAPEKALSQPLSTSAVVFYWGIRAAFPELGLHNIFFSEDYQEEFNNLFDRSLWPDDPTIYVNISSKVKPDDAPPGCENWFVMVNVPARTDLDTPEALRALREKVLDILTWRLGQAIEPLIEVEETLTPRLLARRTSGWQGALYGSNSNSLFSGFWRHPNFSDALPGLFFSGGTVHPGGGIPLALKSGQIAAGLATEYLARI